MTNASLDSRARFFELCRNFGRKMLLTVFKRNIKNAKVDDIVIPIVKTSEEAAKHWNGKPVEFLWIDGSHEYDMVKLDFDLWYPHLIEGGIIAFHDTGPSGPGPRKVVENNIYRSKNFINVGFINSITFAQKVSKNSLKDRLRSRYVLFLKDSYEFARYIKGILYRLRWRLMNPSKWPYYTHRVWDRIRAKQSRGDPRK